MKTSRNIIKEIEQFEPKDGNWLQLDRLLNELWETGDQENFTADLLGVFEKFPEEDGAGVFWSIVHRLENFSTYERELIESLTRQPSEMGLLMLRRIKNSGRRTVAGIDIGKIVRDLLSNEQLTQTLKQELMGIFSNES